MRRLLTFFGVVLMLLTAAVPTAAAPPDESGKVVRLDLPFGLAFEDPSQELVALGGPPAEQGCFGEGFELVPHQGVVTPIGAINVLVKDTAETFFIYRASSIQEVCETVYAGGTPELIAIGTARVVFTDNDVFGDSRNTNTWGGSATGTVYDADGNAMHFNASGRFQFSAKHGFRILHESINLR